MSARTQYYNKTIDDKCCYNGEERMNMDGCDYCDCYTIAHEDDEDLL